MEGSGTVKSEDTHQRTISPRRASARVRVLTGAAAIALAVSAMPASASSGAWYLSQFDMSSVWHTATGSGVVVAEVDTGVNAADADLSGRLRTEIGMQGGAVKQATGDSSSTYDGTQVASLIVGTGSGGSRIQGLAPKASVLPIQIQDVSSNGSATSAGAAIHYSVQHGARIILFPKPLPNTSASFEAAVKYAVQNNAIVIAASGNNGSDAVIGDPCAAPGALCISATTSSGSVATLSSIGPAVTLGAPGAQIPVPAKNGRTSTGSSSHYSSALAAGEAALVWSAHPDWTAGQVIRVMLNTAREGNTQHTRVNDSVGYGIIDPAAAVSAATPPQITNPLLPVAPTTTPSRSSTTHPNAAPANSSGSSIWLPLGLGIAALVLVGGVGAAVLRGRRRRNRNYLSNPAFMPPTYQVQTPEAWPSPEWPPPGQNPYGPQHGAPEATAWPPSPSPDGEPPRQL